MPRFHTSLALALTIALPGVAQAQFCQDPTSWTATPVWAWCGTFGWGQGGSRFERGSQPPTFRDESRWVFTPPPAPPVPPVTPPFSAPVPPPHDVITLPNPTPPQNPPGGPDLLPPPINPPFFPPFLPPPPFAPPIEEPTGAPGGGEQPGNNSPILTDEFPLTSNTVAEPSTYALMTTGLAGLFAVVRRRRK